MKSDCSSRRVTFCNLRFADDIDMIDDDVVELKNMVQELNDEGKRYGLAMNIEKTKTLVFGSRNMDLRISVENREIENVESFVYLGRTSLGTSDAKKKLR